MTKDNLKPTERKKCYFCHNNWNTKKHKFIYSNNRKCYVCVKCQVALNGKQNVQAILDKVPFDMAKLNYQSEDRIERLRKSAGVIE